MILCLPYISKCKCMEIEEQVRGGNLSAEFPLANTQGLFSGLEPWWSSWWGGWSEDVGDDLAGENDYSVGDGPSCDDEGNIMMMMEMIIKRSMVEIWSSRLEVTVCNFLQHQTRPYAHFSLKIAWKLLMLLMMLMLMMMLLMMLLRSSRPGVNVVVGDKTRSTPGLYRKRPHPFLQ